MQAFLKLMPSLIFLGIPLLGVLLVVAERHRRNGERPLTRKAGRIAILMTGGVLLLLGGGFALGWVSYLLDDIGGPLLLVRMIASTTVLLAAALLLLAARNALRVGLMSELRPDEELSVAELARRSSAADELRLSGWLLMLVPMLQLGIFGVFLLFPIAAYLVWAFAARTVRRARDSHFLWTLALAVEREMPLDDEIESFAQSLWRRNRRRYEEIANRIREGRSLVDALELSRVLPHLVVSELREAESAGSLPQALRRLAAHSTSELLHNRVDGTLAVTAVYAWVLLAMVFNVVTFMMYWIVPKLKNIFSDFDVELPAWTVQAVSLSDAAVSNMLLVMPLINLPILAGLVAVIVATVGWGNLNVPLLMRWFPRRDAPGVLRTLSYAVESGRPVPESLETLAEHARRIDLRERFVRMHTSAERGEPVWSVLAVEGFIRGAEAGALEAAAKAGNLHWALRTLADSIGRAMTHRARFWLEVVKPAVVVAVGCVVAFFVIAFFLPLVKLIQELT